MGSTSVGIVENLWKNNCDYKITETQGYSSHISCKSVTKTKKTLSGSIIKINGFVQRWNDLDKWLMIVYFLTKVHLELENVEVKVTKCDKCIESFCQCYVMHCTYFNDVWFKSYGKPLCICLRDNDKEDRGSKIDFALQVSICIWPTWILK